MSYSSLWLVVLRLLDWAYVQYINSFKSMLVVAVLFGTKFAYNHKIPHETGILFQVLANFFIFLSSWPRENYNEIS